MVSSYYAYISYVVVQLLSHVWLSETPWTAHQASLSFTISQSLLKLMSVESTMLSNYLTLCCSFSSSPQSFPASGSGKAPPASVWKHQFFSAQSSLWSNSHICTWLLENHSFYYRTMYFLYVVEFTQSCLTLWDPMDCSMLGFPVHHQLLEFAQSHVHWVSDAIQPSHPLSYPSPPVFNLSHHQGLFQWVSSLHQVAKVLELQLQHQSFQWIFKTDFL